MFEGYTPETVDFLWGIRMNNNREWFLAHKKDYVNHLYEPTKALGNALFQLVFHFIPAVVISVLVIGIHAPASVAMFALFLLSAIFGYGVLWTISFALQMLAFWLINVWSIMTIKNVFINVLSGSMIPLWFMPDWMKGVLMFTPFSSIYFTPVQIYLGEIQGKELAAKLGVQGLWILVLWIIANAFWKRGVKKLVVQGG